MSSMAGDGDAYILNRDWRAIARLNYRFFLFYLVHGYLVHPDIKLPPDAKIAEIGAGTCIWSTELAQRLPPTVTIDAIDISDGQYPSKDWVPENVNLIVHDIYKPLPEDMIGKYDLVRMQNWLIIWRDSTTDLLLGNLLKALKPGGYLQWAEQDPSSSRIFRSPSCTISDEATKEMLTFLHKPRENILTNWVSKLDTTLSQHQFEVISFDRQPVSNANQIPFTMNILQTAEEMALHLKRSAKSQSDLEAGEKLLAITERAAIEVLNGVGVYRELATAVARKPLN